jgi:hypothetical protein
MKVLFAGVFTLVSSGFGVGMVLCFISAARHREPGVAMTDLDVLWRLTSEGKRKLKKGLLLYLGMVVFGIPAI